MAALTIRELDLGNSRDIEQFEQAMYRAFKSYRLEIFDNLWVFDHAAELARTLIPYAAQRILVADVDGAVIGGVAINLDMNAPLQVERCGFSVPKLQDKTAEGLALFTNQLMVGRNVVLVRLAEAADVLLKSLSIATLWGSCDKKHLLGYLQLGFRNIAKVRFNGQDEFLLQRTLSV